MNIELEEVVVQDVTDDSLELAASGAQGDCRTIMGTQPCEGGWRCVEVLAIADR